jgi:hypothetical protein
MNLSHAAAGRARSVEPGVFSLDSVIHATKSEATPNPPSSPYAWKFALARRIGSAEGPSSVHARYALRILIDHSDADGRTWLGIQALLTNTAIKTERTMRKVLDKLVRGGWLRIAPQTWTSLTAEQAAIGRTLPRRGDAGQAPNLYVVLDGRGREACLEGRSRPGIVRTSKTMSSTENTRESLRQNDMGSLRQNDTGEPPANLHPDPDHLEDLSNEESAERVPRVEQSTHIFSKSPQMEAVRLEAWNVIVEVHAEKTKAVYGLPPPPPDLKRDQQQVLARLLDDAAVDVQAKLQARTGVEHKLPDVRRELAVRTMSLYFKRDNEHLRTVKHALRDIPREFHARLIDARQHLLRESHDATLPRRVQIEQPTERTESADKPVEITRQKQHLEPRECVESADKPVDVVALKTPERTASPSPPGLANAAPQFRRMLETLNAPPSPQDFLKSSKPETPDISLPKRPAVSEQAQDKPVQEKLAQDKPTQGKLSKDKPVHKSFEQKQFEGKTFEDKPSPTMPRTPPVERPLGRSGAPRWGAIGPRPTKVRRVSKLTPDEVEPDEEHGTGSTPIR